jgi:hypothetical protein
MCTFSYFFSLPARLHFSSLPSSFRIFSLWHNVFFGGSADDVVARRMSGKRELVTIRQGMQLLRKEAKTKVKGRNKLKGRP